MRCVDLDDLLSAYADGQIVQPQRAALEAHLAGCERCRRVLTRYRQTGSILALTRDEVWTPPDLRLRITLASQQPQPRRRKPAWYAAVSACVAAIAVVSAVLGGHALVPASVATPAVQPQQTVASTLPVASVPHTVHPSTVAGCPRHSILAIAHCLGVSREIVPTILLEERNVRSSGRQRRNHLETQQSPFTAATTVSGAAGLKGGGAHGLNSTGHYGMQAI